MIKTYFLLAVSTHRQNIGYKNKEIDGEVATNAKKRRDLFGVRKWRGINLNQSVFMSH